WNCPVVALPASASVSPSSLLLRTRLLPLLFPLDNGAFLSPPSTLFSATTCNRCYYTTRSWRLVPFPPRPEPVAIARSTVQMKRGVSTRRMKMNGMSDYEDSGNGG
ncbi:hypothetical protein BHM03_00043909, partial [Ensete ventricosum]